MAGAGAALWGRVALCRAVDLHVGFGVRAIALGESTAPPAVWVSDKMGEEKDKVVAETGPDSSWVHAISSATLSALAARLSLLFFALPSPTIFLLLVALAVPPSPMDSASATLPIACSAPLIVPISPFPFEEDVSRFLRFLVGVFSVMSEREPDRTSVLRAIAAIDAADTGGTVEVTLAVDGAGAAQAPIM